MWRIVALRVALLTRVAQAAITITAGPVGPDPLGHAEVHNIIRNSQQRSWCQPGHIRQIITHADCKAKEVENKVCAGSCFSYSLPRTLPQTAGDEALNFCDSCQPSNSTWQQVSLECIADDDSVYEVTKRVQMITSCSCSTCPGSARYDSIVNDDQLRHGEHRSPDLLYRTLPSAMQPIDENEEGGHLSHNDVANMNEAMNGLYTNDTIINESLTNEYPLMNWTSMNESLTNDIYIQNDDWNDTESHPVDLGMSDMSLLSDDGLSYKLGVHESMSDIAFRFSQLLDSNYSQVSTMRDRESEDSYPTSVLQNIGNIEYRLPPIPFMHGRHDAQRGTHQSNLLLQEDPTDDHESPPHLTNLMQNLNSLLKGEGDVKYEELSLNDLKKVLNLQAHHVRKLDGLPIYGASSDGED